MISRHHPNNRMSQMVTYPLGGTMVVTAGLVSDDREGDVSAQTKNVLAKIDRYLSEAGANKAQITHVYIWLPDIADFDAMNKAYDAWVDGENPPARACVEARLADPALKVEIQAFAVKP